MKEISLFRAPTNFRASKCAKIGLFRAFYFRADQVRESKWGVKIKGIRWSITYFEKAKSRSFRRTQDIFPKLTDFSLTSEQNKRMCHLWHFNDHNSGSKYDRETNELILIYSFSSFRWYTLFLHFKIFKIQLHSPLCILFWSVKYAFIC